MIYNKYYQTNQFHTPHSSLDKNSPRLLAVLEIYKQNTDYEHDSTDTKKMGTQKYAHQIRCNQVNLQH